VLDWQGFSADKDRLWGKEGGGVVVGFDSANVVFYDVQMPEVKPETFSSMVHMQAETRLPLPVDQMEVAFKRGELKDDQVSVTIAAARKGDVQRFVSEVGRIGPDRIILDAQAIVQVWSECFGRGEKSVLVLSVSGHKTRACFAVNGELVNSVTVDVGSDEFLSEGGAVAEMFVQDITSVIELFGFENAFEVPVRILSDGSEVLSRMADCLSASGLDAETVLPFMDKVFLPQGFSVQDFYEYRIAIGLGLLWLGGGADELNIFKDVYRVKGGEDKHRFLWPMVSGTIAAVSLVLFFSCLYLTDILSLRSIDSKLNDASSGVSCSMLMERQKLMKQAAMQRPDFVKLFTDFYSDENKGVKLDGFNFKNAQLMSLIGTVKNEGQLYKFQKSLQQINGVSSVKIQNAEKENKNGKINFNITFHYKNFTRKGPGDMVF